MDNAIERIAFEMKQELQIACPVDTSFLRNSITYEIIDGEIIFSMVGYGKYVEYGTLPHIIKAKNKKALSWKGGDHPVKSVRHPGTAPQPFIRNTFRRKLLGLVMKHISMETFEVYL